MPGYVEPERLALAVAAALAALLAVLLIDTLRVRRARSRIPIRIHVAGARGKTTTVRLIAAGLRAAGLRTVAKTTGTRPTLIGPDGESRPWPRRGPASIREQGRFLRAAAALQAEAVVVECMAIRPDLVWASEHLLLRATQLVVTNARLDHAEELGRDPQAMAEALAAAVPAGGEVVLGEDLPAIAAAAERLGARVDRVPLDGLAPEEACRRLAAVACGVAEIGAEAGRDVGAFEIRRIELDGQAVRFANAFACNDVESFRALWSRHGGGPAVMLFNPRADRPLRSRDFLACFASLPSPVTVALPGGAIWLRRHADRLGLATRRLATGDPARALRELAPLGTIWGVGNFRGLGERVTALVQAHGRPC